jgi:hypothetical protein
MGRIKQYSKKSKSKGKNKKKHSKIEGSEDAEVKVHCEEALSVGKKKQIFKKEKAKGIKSRITELKMKSKKLRKKNLDEKKEKKMIAK